MTIRLIFLTALILGLLSIGATQPAPAAQQAFTTHYYVMPKIGPDPEPKTEAEWRDYDPAIKPKYWRFMDVEAFYRIIDDPITPSTSGFGSVAAYVLIDATPATITFLNNQIDVVYLGESTAEAVGNVKFISSFDTKYALIRQTYDSDAKLSDLFKVRTTKINAFQGTDTTTWNDSDTTAWGSLTANSLTQVHISGTDNMDAWDVLSNQGRAHDAGGGGFFSTTDLWHQTTDNAQDQTVQVEWVAGATSNQEARIAGRVVVGSTDTFFYGQNADVGGDDTELFEVVAGTANLIASSTAVNITVPKQMRMVIADNGANTDIDFDVWASSGSPPGTPQIQFSGAVNAALHGKNGYAGVYIFASRSTTTTVEDLQFTNNDAAPAPRRIIFIGKLREAASRWF